MKIENRNIYINQQPRTISDTIKVGERVLNETYGIDVDEYHQKIIFASESTIDDVQKKEYITSNLIGRMAVERGLNVELLFTPSKLGATTTGTDENAIYLSNHFFMSLYSPNKEDVNQREYVSNGCVFAYAKIQELVIRQLRQEVPFDFNSDSAVHVGNVMPAYLRKQNENLKDARVEEFASEFSDFMAKNMSYLNFTVRGFELNINLDTEKIFSIMTGQDLAICTLLGNIGLNFFQKSMSDKFFWFKPSADLETGTPMDSFYMNSAVSVLKSTTEAKTVKDVFDLYKSSKLGASVGENLIRTLLIKKHQADDFKYDDTVADEVNENDWGEELEEGENIWLEQIQGRKSGKAKGKKLKRNFED